MALPFILGLAVGAGAVVAYNNSKKIKEATSEVFEKSKDIVSDVKKNVDATVDCIKEKVEKKEEEAEPIKEEAKKPTRRKRTVTKKTKEESDTDEK